ncbi:MAG TPA: hypothetical protein VN408_40365 [Actinoplanes sp.]|nr:hypothetical protein [Actinoplanes sp.]
MTGPEKRDPPWVWERIPDVPRAELWRRLADWVDWLQEAYAPWVLLPDCWPAHEGLVVELRMFRLWHRWLMAEATQPADGVRWHQELRRSAPAWRELASCRHEPPVRHHEQVRLAARERRDAFLAQAVEKRV